MWYAASVDLHVFLEYMREIILISMNWKHATEDIEMKKRYKNILINNMDDIKIINDDEVLVYQDEGIYDDVYFSLEDVREEVDSLKPLLLLVAQNLSRMDEMVQQYDSKCNFAEKFDLAVIYPELPDIIRFVYWGNDVNTEFETRFQVKDGQFMLITYGRKNVK